MVGRATSLHPDLPMGNAGQIIDIVLMWNIQVNEMRYSLKPFAEK
ncbi:hypothetical protein X805_35300 [Sphaerotilus natans subsp. natans DSM 6575]|uniref:Uncharacterized protein n=1 Tax=Sphaerotilus natans subsp. natans DSM 6575 TaxID=1286631 RepID=A0A059KHF5_9BURK|nr:hypothetical protein X805_35300 [Sphaerotilus natans subsp. natans DSM 6575]